MKKTITSILATGALLFSLSMSLTSCDEMLDYWDKPVSDVYTPTTFKFFNPNTGQYEKIDLSSYDVTKLTPSSVASLLSGGILEAGKYIVEGHVNYTGDFNVGGDGTLELYLQDDASFTITGGLNASDIDGIKIAGQKEGSGKLIITAEGVGINAKTLTIDGGELRVKGGENGVTLDPKGALTVNGGDHTINATARAIYGSLVFNNGRLVASGGGAEPAISGSWTLAKDTELKNLTTGATARADGGVYNGPFRTSHDGVEMRKYEVF